MPLRSDTGDGYGIGFAKIVPGDRKADAAAR
jgi:hypothetical protein